MSVSIETSHTGSNFKTLDAEQDDDDAAAGREIYKNLRWPEAHELAGVIAMLIWGRGKCWPPYKGE